MTRRKTKKQSQSSKDFKKSLYLNIPLGILLSLLFFMVFQWIGENYGFLPTIMLSGNFRGNEEVILFVINLAFSIFLGLLITFYLTRRL